MQIREPWKTILSVHKVAILLKLVSKIDLSFRYANWKTPAAGFEENGKSVEFFMKLPKLLVYCA